MERLVDAGFVKSIGKPTIRFNGEQIARLPPAVKIWVVMNQVNVRKR